MTIDNGQTIWDTLRDLSVKPLGTAALYGILEIKSNIKFVPMERSLNLHVGGITINKATFCLSNIYARGPYKKAKGRLGKFVFRKWPANMTDTRIALTLSCSHMKERDGVFGNGI